jgi:hypothetical protein
MAGVSRAPSMFGLPPSRDLAKAARELDGKEH